MSLEDYFKLFLHYNSKEKPIATLSYKIKINTMEELYNKHKGLTFHRRGVKMVLCGYTDCHLILGTNEQHEMFFEGFKEDYYTNKDYKYYMYLDENEIL